MKPSGIITLTTDFGLSDPYVAIMKGVILSINPQARIVDVTHQISPGLVFQAAGIMEETVKYFPEGTVNLIVVDPGVGGQRRPIAVETEESFFVGPDNGVLWPIVEGQGACRVVHLTATKYFLPHISDTFHGRDIFAPVAAHISLGTDIKKMGSIITDPMKLKILKPQIKGNAMYGEVIRVDNFGNLITNINQAELEAFLQTASPITTLGNLTIRGVRHTYTSVSEGEPLVLYGSSHLLEIAVNMGKASDILGLRHDRIMGALVTITKDDA
jgi:hypothetical protein